MSSKAFGWIERTALGFWTASLLLFLLEAPPTPERNATAVAVSLLIVAFVVVSVARARARPLAATFLRVVQVAGSFAVGHTLAGRISTEMGVGGIEQALARADLQLFGRFPTVVVQPWVGPWVVDWLSVSYVLFYALPLPLYLLLRARKRDADAEHYVLAIHFSMLFCFAGYILLPAATPAGLFAALGWQAPVTFDAPLPQGVVSPYIQKFLANATSNTRDAFPSGHTTTTVTAFVMAWRLHRPTAWVLLPLCVSVLCATLALRFHFGVDLLAGLALAAFSIWLARVAWRSMASSLGLAPAGEAAGAAAAEREPGSGGRAARSRG